MDFDCLPEPVLRPSLSMMVGTCLPFVCTLVWQPPLNDFLLQPPLSLSLSPLSPCQCRAHGCWLLLWAPLGFIVMISIATVNSVIVLIVVVVLVAVVVA